MTTTKAFRWRRAAGACALVALICSVVYLIARLAPAPYRKLDRQFDPYLVADMVGTDTEGFDRPTITKIFRLVCGQTLIELKSPDIVNGAVESKHFGQIRVSYSETPHTIYQGTDQMDEEHPMNQHLSYSMQEGEIQALRDFDHSPEDSELIRAAWDGSLEEAKQAVASGAHLYAQDFEGLENNSPLMLSSEAGGIECVRFLIQSGADVNGQNLFGQTALTKASSGSKLNLLLAAGANVNQKDFFGSTALIEQARVGHLDCVRALLSAGADPGAVEPARDDRAPETALSVSKKFPQIRAALRAAGATK